MTTRVQLDGRTSGQNADNLDLQASRLWENPGRPIVFIGEASETERVTPRPDLQKDSRIRLGLMHCVVAASPEQEHQLRNAMRALHQQQTAVGTFDEITGGFAFDHSVLDTLPEGLDATEAVRVRGAMVAMVRRLAEIARTNDRDYVRLRKDVKSLAEIGRRVLDEQLALDPKAIAEAELIAAAAKVDAEDAAQLEDATERLDETVPEPVP